ncbi:TRAF4 [Cordylochernes scorpioides]|uniref:TRAF4 n=1 Tax=Cordylochernes scorpioides TaxID=51811 RepID=A0ABY6KN83_9ARAC|nr:TRAF4 [Cordylochernes scorpioides]
MSPTVWIMFQNMENTCPFQGCSQTFSNTLEAMLHSTLCQFCMVDCPQSCGTKILRKDLASHMTVACKPLFGSCQFCGAFLTRDSLQQHEALCGQISVSPGESVHSDSKNPQSCGLLDQGCRNEADVCLKEKDEKLLNDYLPLICDSLRELSLEMSQCKNLLKENLDQIKVRNEFRGESLESPIIQLLQEISSSMKAQSGEKEELKTWQREMSGLMAVMTRQLEISQDSLSQILVNQRSTGSSLAGVQNLTAMLSNKIEDISNQHLVDLRYIRTELEGVKSELSTGPTTTSLGEDHLQGLERDLKNTKKELETVKAGFQVTINELSTMKTELQNTKGELNAVKSELHVNKKELETMLTKQQVDKKVLEAMQIELIHKKEEIDIVKKGVNCKNKKIDSLKKDLQEIKEELESVKTEQQGTKEELATVRTELQTTTTSCCDVKCQELENPVKMADVRLDLTLGAQNWFPPGVGYSDLVNDLQKYLYGSGDHRDKLQSFSLFVFYNWTKFSQDISGKIIENIDGTEYNVMYKWKVGGKIEVEVSFHQSGGGVNTLAQYKYFILYMWSSMDTGRVVINSVLVGQTCRYLIDTEKLEKYFTRKLKSYGIRTIYKNSPNLLSSLRHPHTKSSASPAPLRSVGAVYSVSCEQCPATYVGETGRSNMENTCPFQGCSQTFSNTLEAMLHSSFCQFCLVDCPQSCGTKILRKDLASHMTVACKPLFGSCQFCEAVLTRDSLQQHEALCGQIGVNPGESVHSDSKNPQSCSLLDQGCRNEADVCLKEKDEKLLNVYLPLICDSLRDLSLEMSQCKNLLKENLDQIKVRNEFRGESLESPIIQLLQEISSSMKAQSGEKEDLKAWQREMSGLLGVMTRQLETSQASLSQIFVTQRSTGSSLSGVQNLTAMLSNKIEDISNQHLVDLGYIRTELEGVRSELSTGPTTTSLEQQGTKEELATVRTELQTPTTSCCDVKCQENPVKMADVGLDLTLGTQNWFTPDKGYYAFGDDLKKYLRKWVVVKEVLLVPGGTVRLKGELRKRQEDLKSRPTPELIPPTATDIMTQLAGPIHELTAPSLRDMAYLPIYKPFIPLTITSPTIRKFWELEDVPISKAQLGIKNAPSPSLQESIQNSPSLKEFTQNFPSLPGSIQTSPGLPDSVQRSPSLTLSLQSSKHNSPTPLQVSVHSLKEAMSPLVEMPSSPGCSKQIPIPIEEDSIESQNRVDNLPSYPMSPEQSYTLSSASVEDFKAQSGPKSPTSPTRGSESCRYTQGLLRVGGRLKYSYLNENQNFPLLQPKPPRQESLIKNLLTENADIPEAIDENQEDSSILETTFVIEDEESNKDIGTPKIEISEVSVIDKLEGKYSKEPVVSVEALDKKELCHDDPAHLNVVEADLNRPKEATSGIINISTEANESASKEKAVSVEIVDTSTKDYLQSGEKAKLSRWKPIDSLCLEDVKESEDDDENYSSSAYIEWPEILKKEVLRPEALEKAVNLEDFEKAAESRQLSKEHLEESTEQGSCIKAESKPWEDPIESDLAATESDNPAVPERELANESENLIQDSPQSDTQRWKLIPLPFKQ